MKGHSQKNKSGGGGGGGNVGKANPEHHREEKK